MAPAGWLMSVRFDVPLPWPDRLGQQTMIVPVAEVSGPVVVEGWMGKNQKAMVAARQWRASPSWESKEAVAARCDVSIHHLVRAVKLLESGDAVKIRLADEEDTSLFWLIDQADKLQPGLPLWDSGVYGWSFYDRAAFKRAVKLLVAWYVGESVNLLGRSKEHHRRPSNQAVGYYLHNGFPFCYETLEIDVPGKQDRLRLENHHRSRWRLRFPDALELNR